MVKDKLAPIHPGEVLLEEFLKPMGLSQNRLAIDMTLLAKVILAEINRTTITRNLYSGD